MIHAQQFPMCRPRLAFPLTVAGALLVGAAIGSGGSAGLLLVGAAGAGVLLFLPLAWLACVSMLAALTFRVLAPTATGPASAAPDAMLALVFVRVAVDASLGRSASGTSPAKALGIALGLFLSLAAASTIHSGDPVFSLLASMRQFLRFPLWALALFAADLTWDEAKVLVRLVLIGSLIQLPFALHQYGSPMAASPYPGVHFFKGDNVSGTFGMGGSSSMMIFLVIAALLWLGLVLQRTIPGWILWILAPALVIPMALGSAAVFVVLLPAALLALFVRSALSPHTRLTMGGLTGGMLLLAIAVWAAGALALAPGFAGAKQGSATSILSNRYLQQYVATTAVAGPTSRLGFLHLAVETNVQSGASGILLGQGPSRAVIGSLRLQVGANRVSVLAPASVQSVQRLILGFGFPALAVYALMVVVPVAWVHRRAQFAVDGMARALALILPVAAGVYLIAGLYNAAWTDPGVAVTFWALVVAATAGLAAPSEAPPP